MKREMKENETGEEESYSQLTRKVWMTAFEFDLKG